ncbi:hypothetical protein ACP275_12G029700 [Erythranthe tilingii]
MKKGSLGGWFVVVAVVVLVAGEVSHHAMVAAQTNCNPLNVLTACSGNGSPSELCCTRLKNLVIGPCYCRFLNSKLGQDTINYVINPRNLFTICRAQPLPTCP